MAPTSTDGDTNDSDGSSGSGSYDSSGWDSDSDSHPASVSSEVGVSEPTQHPARVSRSESGSSVGDSGEEEEAGGEGSGGSSSAAALSMSSHAASLATAIGSGLRGFIGKMTQSTLHEDYEHQVCQVDNSTVYSIHAFKRSAIKQRIVLKRSATSATRIRAATQFLFPMQIANSRRSIAVSGG